MAEFSSQFYGCNVCNVVMLPRKIFAKVEIQTFLPAFPAVPLQCERCKLKRVKVRNLTR